MSQSMHILVKYPHTNSRRTLHAHHSTGTHLFSAVDEHRVTSPGAVRVPLGTRSPALGIAGLVWQRCRWCALCDRIVVRRRHKATVGGTNINGRRWQTRSRSVRRRTHDAFGAAGHASRCMRQRMQRRIACPVLGMCFNGFLLNIGRRWC